MKNPLRLLLALFLLAAITIPASAFNYYITFTGSGASTTVDSVVVQNLSKGTQVAVPAGIQLRLYDVDNAVNELIATSDLAFIYPNPMTGNATYTFTAKYAGKTQIGVFGLDGRKVAGLDADLQQGKNSFQLSLPTGVYLVQAVGNGFSYTTKTISPSSTTTIPKISISGNSSYTKPQRAPAPEVKLQYSTGDQILYKGYSGNYCTIVTDKPTEDKTTDFKFVECTDADSNHYAVVHIGNQTWMAENLKTTKYSNGEAIGTTIPVAKDIRDETEPKYQWAYSGNENDASKYGRLYTWHAANDSRKIAPTGWHVPNVTEWTELENYLIANGNNYDGTTTGNKIAKSLAANTDWYTSTNTGSIGNDLIKNNNSGFTALPGGARYDIGLFSYIRDSGYWWSSTEDISTKALYRFLAFNMLNLNIYRNSKGYGFSVRCVSGETPTLTTTAVSSEIWDFAVCGGNITNDGGSAVTARGVCWSLNPNPTINDSISKNGNGIGSFSSLATNLIADTTYYLRAFATNSVGTAYGNTVTFRTSNPDLLRGCIEAYPNDTGVIDSAYFNGELVYCTKIYGEYIYQGDIILEDPTNMNGARRKAAGINESFFFKLWPENTVYYTINENFNNSQRIYDAIKEYHEKTNIKFVPRTNENHYIEFIYDKDGCSSNVGMFLIKQFIKIADWGDASHVIHEIGHAIGLLHEQSKTGRDEYVTILWDNIECKIPIINCEKHNFEEYKNSINTPGFDFKSIMLYNSWGFSKFIKTNSKGGKYLETWDKTTATILKKDGTTFETKDNKHLSESDITLINSLYPPVNKETVTDIDGNVYHTVTIGTQTWMVENLNTSKYSNGETIPNITDGTEWTGLTTGAWCNYNNDVANGNKYGKLFNWYAVADSRNIAPSGWHVPTITEWAILENYLIANGFNYDGTITGNKIAKSLASTTDWVTSTIEGAVGNDLTKNNKSGFTALPGGYRSGSSSSGIGTNAIWWSSTENDISTAWRRSIFYSEPNMVNATINPKTYGRSIRLVKD